MEELSVDGIDYKKCLWCGTDKRITIHHVIPKRYKPKRTILIPLCREHHKIIDDILPKDINSDTIIKVHKLNELNKKIYLKRNEFNQVCKAYCRMKDYYIRIHSLNRLDISPDKLKNINQCLIDNNKNLSRELNLARTQRDKYSDIIMGRCKDKKRKENHTLNCRM